MPGAVTLVTVPAVDYSTVDPTSEVATYLQLARLWRDAITDPDAPDRLVSSDRLDSVYVVTEATGLSPSTVRRAIAVLKGEGLVRSSPGRGVYVR